MSINLACLYTRALSLPGYVAIGAVIATTAVVAWCGRRLWLASHKDTQIEQINTLAHIISTNDDWWLFDTPFSPPTNVPMLENTISTLRKAPPHKYATLMKTLATNSEIPAQVLKRLTYEVMGSREISRADVERRAPYFLTLLKMICQRSDVTHLTTDTLDGVFFPMQGQESPEEKAMRSFKKFSSLSSTLVESVVEQRHIEPIHDTQYAQINVLAQIISENTTWWLFEGPFRTPTSKTMLDKAMVTLRKTPPHKYDAIVKMLAASGEIDSLVPIQALKRLTYDVMGAREITRAEVERWAPHLPTLLLGICTNAETTRMSSKTLDKVFFPALGQDSPEGRAIQEFSKSFSQ